MNHPHCVLTLPPGDDAFSNRIKAIKIRFVRAVPPNERRSAVRVARGERGIWQRRFWEHDIRDEADYARHMDVCALQSGQTQPCSVCCAMAVFDVSLLGAGECLPSRLVWRGCYPLLLASTPPAGAASDARIADTQPSASSTLGRNVRIAYATDEPLMLWARPYLVAKRSRR